MKFVFNDDPWPFTGLSFDYRVLKDGVQIASGRLEDITGSGSSIYLNRVAQGFLSAGTLDFSQEGVNAHPSEIGTFVLYSGSTPLKTETYVFGFRPGFETVLSEPVNGKLDPRMKFFFSAALENITTVNLDEE